MALQQTQFILTEDQIPRAWYNINADLPAPLSPPLNPVTKEPARPEDFAPLFPMALVAQEMSNEREIEIPEPVLQAYTMYRPSPLFRAHRLERALGSTAKIFYKYEGGSPAGSHKPNTAIAQAYFNKEEGVTRLTTETGAGQWGTALAMAGAMFGLEVMIYQVRASYDAKPGRRNHMKMYGADVVASPSDRTAYGRAVLAETPDTPGSLGIAISEGVEDAATHENSRYCLGSVLNHVLLHQTVIGQEAMAQMELAGEDPDIIVACAGGGSNFAGLTFPFIGKKLRGEADYRFIAAEPAAAPSLTRGVYAYDYGDTGQMAPIVKMHTLGHDFVPDPIHAGGLRYHGMSPQVSLLKDHGVIEAQAVPQSKTFDAARTFTRNELALPAPEPAHAISVVIDLVEEAKAAGTSPTILFNMCGHGHFDASSYTRYLEGELEDFELPEERIQHALETVPSV